jgi:hypothetical protein
VLLFCVGERTGENEYETVRIDGGLNRRLDCSGQDDLDGDISPVALYL